MSRMNVIIEELKFSYLFVYAASNVYDDNEYKVLRLLRSSDADLNETDIFWKHMMLRYVPPEILDIVAAYPNESPISNTEKITPIEEEILLHLGENLDYMGSRSTPVRWNPEMEKLYPGCNTTIQELFPQEYTQILQHQS